MSGRVKDADRSILTGDADTFVGAGDRWYALLVDDRQTEWAEHRLGDYVQSVRDWRLNQGREVSATVATMKHEIREI